MNREDMNSVGTPSSLDLPCPRCGYNVVVQVLKQMGRCPECQSELPPMAIEPRSSLEARWKAACGHLAHQWPIYQDGLAVAAFVNLLILCSYPLAMVTGFGWAMAGWLAHAYLPLWLASVLFGIVMLIVGLVVRTKRRLVLGLLNGVVAVGETAIAAFFLYILFNMAP